MHVQGHVRGAREAERHGRGDIRRRAFRAEGFAEKNGLTFPLLCDFKREVVQKYGVVWKNLGGVEGYSCANRAIFVADDSGKVLFKWVAENPGVLPDFEAVTRAL